MPCVEVGSAWNGEETTTLKISNSPEKAEAMEKSRAMRVRQVKVESMMAATVDGGIWLRTSDGEQVKSNPVEKSGGGEK